METKLIQDFKAALRAGVPLLCIQTPDPASVIKQINAITEEKGTANEGAPLISFDISSGLKAVNKAGEDQVQQLCVATQRENILPSQITDPAAAMKLFAHVDRKTIIFIHNGHRFIGSHDLAEAIVGQAIWNLRDQFKSSRKTLVILTPGIQLPAELKQDMLVLEDPLPTEEDLKVIVEKLCKSTYKEAKVKPEEDDIKRAVRSIKGLAAFSAEQVVAMSLTKEGIDSKRLWDRKKAAIEQNPGMRIWGGKESFNDVRGVPVIKEYLTKVMNGQDPPTVLVFWDELEKAFAGSKGDSSGVSQEMHGQILSWMADNEVLAIRFAGIQGCSKSYISKALAGEYKIPLIINNISELKGQFVGQSTQQLKNALAAIVASGKPLVIATCNDESALSSELKDRFNLGTFFFDLPTREERMAVWDVWKTKYKLDHPLPSNEDGWTPRNIHDCCMLAWQLRITLEEAACYIVPVIRADPKRIEELRRMADRKYLSASKSGVYTFSNVKQTQDSDQGRIVNLDTKVGEA
jgi:hypothetical protein